MSKGDASKGDAGRADTTLQNAAAATKKDFIVPRQIELATRFDVKTAGLKKRKRSLNCTRKFSLFIPFNVEKPAGSTPVHPSP